MTGHSNGRGKPGAKPSKAEADARDLGILRAVAQKMPVANIAARFDVTESWVRKLLADTRRDSRAPMGNNRDVQVQP